MINARNSTLTLSSPADPAIIRNNQYNADGSLNPLRVRPIDAGFGAATGALPLRTMQMQIRFMF